MNPHSVAVGYHKNTPKTQNPQTKPLICGIHSSTRKPITPLTIGDYMRTPVICSLSGLQRISAGFVFALSLALSGGARRQITTGTSQVIVEDANGAVVPGVNVEIKNVETNISR